MFLVHDEVVRPAEEAIYYTDFVICSVFKIVSVPESCLVITYN